MRLSKRQLKRIIREEYAKIKRARTRTLNEGSWSDDPIEDAYLCVSETCELEEGSTQITHDLYYIAEQFGLDGLLRNYVREGEPCVYGQTDEAWKEFLMNAGPEKEALATTFSEFWERHYMG